MEPGNNVQNNVPEEPKMEVAAEEVVVAEEKPVVNAAPKSDVVFNGPKKNTGMILGMVIFAILAAGGIGFGVWQMMDANTQIESLNKQIDSLKSQNSSLSEQIEKLESELKEEDDEIEGDEEEATEEVTEDEEEVVETDDEESTTAE